MKRAISIRKSLITSVAALTLLPMMTAMVISLVMFHLETTDRIRLDNQKVAQTVATAVELFIARPVVMLKQIRDEANEPVHVGMDLAAVANSTLNTDPLFESVLFVNATGDLIGVAGEGVAPVKKDGVKQNYSGTDLFKKIKQYNRTVWSEPYTSLKSGESVISIALPWKGGMISGTMNLSYLCKLVEPTKTYQNSYAFIVSPQGRLVAHPDRALVAEKEAFISIPQITAGFQGTTGTYNFNIVNRPVIGSVLPFSQNEWVIVSVHDKENTYASLYRMERLLGLLTIMVIGGSLFYSFKRVDRITAPILAFTQSTRRIAEGEHVVDAGEGSEYIEINALHENFQAMAKAVAERENELQVRNEELAMTEEELRSQVDEYIKTHDALVSEKVKLESILSSMGEGLSIQDMEYRVILQNRAHIALVGDALGKYCYQAYRHFDAICPECPMKMAFEDGDIHMALRKLERNGVDIYLEISVSPLRNSVNEIIGGIEVVRDVTDREMADAEIRRLNQELETRVIERTAELEIANRELESFSYSVSHDLRAPLRHISSYSKIIESEYSENLDADAKYYIARIMAGCGKMGLLIDDLLELSQVTRTELRRKQVNFSKIANAIAVSLAESDPMRKASFRIVDGLEVIGDEGLLEVMLNNLMSNAWKYSSKKAETVIEFGCKTIAARQVFFVRDNGAGFDKSCADNLFAPFQRVHGNEFEGTGIGLAIVQRVVHRHGGKIWADAVVDEGATFYFTLKY
ncbi:MAG: PAS domain-containing protein [Geobacteraceae bacterium]|nr:PAS domain-containing protein [Geobacteraceae bacterium]